MRNERKFQSALPRGERHYPRTIYPKHQTISIRAPARGATVIIFFKVLLFVLFQSALPRGERHSGKIYICYRDRFQSALPRGERPTGGSMTPRLPYFNPRSREGSDAQDRYTENEFINFNPRSREGSDKMVMSLGRPETISIRAPARGATIINPLLTLSSRFQSALPRGERQSTRIFAFVVIPISIRAPARGAT